MDEHADHGAPAGRTATGIPDEVPAEYESVFRKLGVGQTRELRLRGREAGEITRLISGALARHRPDIAILQAEGPEEGAPAGPGARLTGRSGAVHLQKLGPVRDLLDGLGAAGWPGRANRARTGTDPAYGP